MTKAINIEVTIAQELRDLIAARAGLRGVVAPDHQVDVSEGGAAERVGEGMDVQSCQTSCVVRRDGQRPKRFVGMSVVSFDGEIEVGGMRCLQHMTLYQSQGLHHYLALSLHFPGGVRSRPLFDCYDIAPGTGTQVLTRWFARISAHLSVSSLIAVGGDASPDPLSAFAAGFHALTAHSLIAETMPAERNELCLQ